MAIEKGNGQPKKFPEDQQAKGFSEKGIPSKEGCSPGDPPEGGDSHGKGAGSEHGPVEITGKG